MHRLYKSNSGLGYKQYAYLFRLDKERYLCCNDPDGDTYAPCYTLGAVFDDIDYHELITVYEDEFNRNSELHETLLDYLSENLQND